MRTLLLATLVCLQVACSKWSDGPPTHAHCGGNSDAGCNKWPPPDAPVDGGGDPPADAPTTDGAIAPDASGDAGCDPPPDAPVDGGGDPPADAGWYPPDGPVDAGYDPPVDAH